MSSSDRRRAGELTEIRKELRENRFYVEDAELRAEISDWLDRSHEETDADTAREFVESELNSLLGQHMMYHAPTLDRGEEGFPDECEGCRHYGSACPVLRDDVEVRWRERKLAQAATEAEARRIYQRQAIDTSCVVIPDRLEAWDSRHADFIREGETLLARVEDAVKDDLEELDDELSGLAGAELAADGGGDR